MFCCKKEICNAYTELNDPVVQRSRFEQQVKKTFFTISSVEMSIRLFVLLFKQFSNFTFIVIEENGGGTFSMKLYYKIGHIV